MNDNGMIEMTVERYVELVAAEEELERLMAAGVDNWEGY